MAPHNEQHDYDQIVIGSGFGGSVSAMRLAEKGYRVAVMEQGRRWTPENLPESSWRVRRYFWRPKLGLYGFFNMRFFKHVVVLQGNAVGGGSITYAQTLWQPKDVVWQQGEWAGLADWTSLMPQHYATAKRMLGATRNQRLAEADERLKVMAEAAGVADSYYVTDVGVFFGDDDKPQGASYPDPYFDGKGPARNSCIGCGGCMMGCRYNAKNTLDKNYLYFAEQLGATVHAETEVTAVVPLDGAEGATGYRVHTRSTVGWRKVEHSFTTQGIVFAGGALGTQALLFKMKQAGHLPHISDMLGHKVRTNAESLIGVRYLGAENKNVDNSKGVAIGSGVFLNEHTHIEATRYPRGSDLLGTLLTFMVGGRAGRGRIVRWMGVMLRELICHPIKTMQMILPFGFARQSLILLCMQTLDGHITMTYDRPWYSLFGKRLRSTGAAVPTYIPEANDFAKLGAQITGGTAGMSITEVLLNIPMTAHCLGGATMGRTVAEGVVNARLEVFGYQNMRICDGSVVSANLGVNPSLTITALSEYGMGFVPQQTHQEGAATR